MREKILSVVLVIIAFVSFPFVCRGQEIIQTENGDTLITITPHQLSVINCAFSDLKFSELTIEEQGKIIAGFKKRQEVADSLINQQEYLLKIREEIMNENINMIQLQAKKECKKKLIIGGGVGVIVGIIVGVLVAK